MQRRRHYRPATEHRTRPKFTNIDDGCLPTQFYRTQRQAVSLASGQRALYLGRRAKSLSGQAHHTKCITHLAMKTAHSITILTTLMPKSTNYSVITRYDPRIHVLPFNIMADVLCRSSFTSGSNRISPPQSKYTFHLAVLCFYTRECKFQPQTDNMQHVIESANRVNTRELLSRQ
jgi:hypothetical protein